MIGGNKIERCLVKRRSFDSDAEFYMRDSCAKTGDIPSKAVKLEDLTRPKDELVLVINHLSALPESKISEFQRGVRETLLWVLGETDNLNVF